MRTLYILLLPSRPGLYGVISRSRRSGHYGDLCIPDRSLSSMKEGSELKPDDTSFMGIVTLGLELVLTSFRRRPQEKTWYRAGQSQLGSQAQGLYCSSSIQPIQ
jgi:hypothetical protein